MVLGDVISVEAGRLAGLRKPKPLMILARQTAPCIIHVIKQAELQTLYCIPTHFRSFHDFRGAGTP